MKITTLTSKGSPLTHKEMDDNFNNLLVSTEAAKAAADDASAQVSVLSDNISRPDAPTLNINSNSVNESTIHYYPINNFDSNLIYSITSSLKSNIGIQDNTVVYETPSVDVNTTDTLSFSYSDGTNTSKTSTYNIRVNTVSISADTTIQVTDFTDELSINNIYDINTNLTAEKNNSIAISNVYEQESTDDDWINNTSSINYKLPELTILPDTTQTLLSVQEPVAEGENLTVYNTVDSDTGLVSGKAGAVALVNGTTSVHDIFGDGSAVATYNLDGDTKDLGGNYDGTATGNVTYGTGKFGQCAIFDGSNSTYIRNSSLDSGGNSAITFSFWGKFSTSGGDLIVFNKGDANTDAAIQMPDSNGTCRLYIRSNLKYQDVSDFFISDGNWHHYAFVIDSNGANHYVDGSSITTTTQVMSNFSTPMDICTFIDGSIDQVRIFNRALTSDEITKLYNEQSTKYNVDISNMQLTAAPSLAWQNSNVLLSTVVESTEERCIAQNEPLEKISSTTTNFVGSNIHQGLIQTGDMIQLDNSLNVICDNVTEENISTVKIHDIFEDGSAVATYNLDGDAKDLGGNYDGTATDVTYSDGKFGKAGVFNGSSSYIDTDINENAGLKRGFSCWVNKFDSYIFSNQDMYSSNNGSASYTIQIYKTRLIFTTDKYNGSTYGGVRYDLPSDYSSMGWINIVLTCDDIGYYKAYLNGALLQESADQDIWEKRISSNSSLRDSLIGKRPGSTDGYGTGSIDQVRIFNRALTADEITRLYNEYKYKYTCEFNEVNTIPTSAKILDRAVFTADTTTFDDTTQIFTKQYKKISQQGRYLKYKIKADKNIEIDKLIIQMNTINEG